MWLDRLANSTPSGSPPPTNRSYTSTPRRQTGLASNSAQRPPFSARSSTLSLGSSNDSTTSLLASRRLNGSALKQSTTIPDGPNPLDVLEKLLGLEGKKSFDTRPGINGVHAGGENDFELDFEGLSLHELALGDSSPVQEDSVYNSQTIDECMYSQVSIPPNTDRPFR